MAAPTKDDLDSVADGILEASYCTNVDDFFAPPARDLAGRYLPGFLEQLVITPTELAHSAKYHKRLHDAGRTLMNAVDKVATMQARFKGESAAKRLKEMHALVSATSKKLMEDEKDKPIPNMTPENYLDVLGALKAQSQAERDYLSNRVLTEYLTQFKVWKDKIAVLVRIVRLSQGKDGCRYAEHVLGEALRCEPAMDQLFGLPERLEARANDLIDLWKGEWVTRETAASSELVADINALIAEGVAPSARGGIEYSLMRLLTAKDPIRSAEPEVEVQALFELGRRMWLGNGLLGGTKALGLLEKRQARYINTEGVTDLLRERKVLADRIAYLMQLNALAIGPSNRATLKSFISHYFGDQDFVPRVIAGHEPPVAKLQVLTTTHKALRTSSLSDEEKGTYLALVENAQMELMKKSRLFEQVDKKGGGPAQKVLTLLDLCRKGTFIEGRNLDMVKQLLVRYLNDPDFGMEYLGGATGEDRDRKAALLIKTLQAFNIQPPPGF